MKTAAGELTVWFEGDARKVDPTCPNGLAFGRGAALDLDSNPFMHRQVGRFVHHDGVWWIENLSRWTPISVVSEGVATTINGSAGAPLVHAVSIIRFTSGSCNYELRAELDRAAAPPVAPVIDNTDLTATFQAVDVPLTDEQRLMVVALAESRLRDGAPQTHLPTNASVAARLGWSKAKLNRKLDWLCGRLDKAGVAGLRSQGRRASDRRRFLLDHLVSRGEISAADLPLLDDYPLAE